MNPDGGPAIPVSVNTDRAPMGGTAIPVYGYASAPTDGRPAQAGAAMPVRVLTAADLVQNGGTWVLEGRYAAMPVYTAPSSSGVMGGPAIAVYPINAWPPSATPPVVIPWYLSGGVVAANCIAAYQPKGAASLAASYINLANPGTNNAAPGVAPTWDATNGFKFADNQYLVGPTVTGTEGTLIIRFSNLIDGNLVMFGGSYGLGAGWDQRPGFERLYCSYGSIQNTHNVLPQASGVIAVTKSGVYLDGTLVVGSGWANSANLVGNILWVGDMRQEVYPFNPRYIQAYAAYNVQLTVPQIQAVSTAAAAL